MIGHYDPELTAEYRKSGRFEDRGSRAYIRKEGSLRLVLAGRDKSNLREQCFERDGFRCVDRPDCAGRLEMSHTPPMSDPEGSDEIDKVRTRCKRHHAEYDHHAVKWSRSHEAAE